MLNRIQFCYLGQDYFIGGGAALATSAQRKITSFLVWYYQSLMPNVYILTLLSIAELVYFHSNTPLFFFVKIFVYRETFPHLLTQKYTFIRKFWINASSFSLFTSYKVNWQSTILQRWHIFFLAIYHYELIDSNVFLCVLIHSGHFPSFGRSFFRLALKSFWHNPNSQINSC